MINVDIKSLLLHLNNLTTNALQAAAGLAVSRSHYEVAVEHFLQKILENSDSDWSLILAKYSVDAGQLRKTLDSALEDYPTGNSGKPVFSPILLDLVQEAWLISSIDFGDTKIRSGALLAALLSKPSYYSTGKYMDLLREINKEELIKNFWTITKPSVEATVTAESATPVRSSASGQESFLDRFCVDFTENAKQGRIDRVFGRDKEIRLMIDILARRRKNNPICVGEPGVGKTAVVEGLALRIIENDVPEMLKGTRLVGLDMGLLEAGAGMKGEFENRLNGVITEIKQSETPMILFIDEAHTLIGAGGAAGGGDAANLLKPALARGELRTVAATTWSEYKKYFEKDPALARRFQLVKLDEPDTTTTTLILRGIKNSYEKSHKVIIRDDAVQTASEFADRYIQGRFLPDKAIDLLDTSCARISINLSAKPPALEDIERSIAALQLHFIIIEQHGLQHFQLDSNDIFHSASIKAEVWNDRCPCQQGRFKILGKHRPNCTQYRLCRWSIFTGSHLFNNICCQVRGQDNDGISKTDLLAFTICQHPLIKHLIKKVHNIQMSLFHLIK